MKLARKRFLAPVLGASDISTAGSLILHTAFKALRKNLVKTAVFWFHCLVPYQKGIRI
jgi:hypothetical protein